MIGELDNYDAVLFDLDGVITDTAKFHFHAWKKLADDLGISFTEEDNEQLKGVDRMASLDFILSLGNHPELSALEKHELAERKNAYYKKLIEDLNEQDILPGVTALLENLKSGAKKVGVASASQNATAIIERLGLSGYFDHIADARLARSKPAPDIFLFSAYGVGVHPTKCVGIEDSIAGLASIKACGMYAISVGLQELAKHSDLHLDDLVIS